MTDARSATITRLSRKVAYALRHSPDLPTDGWVSVSMLRRSLGLSREDLAAVMAHSERFELDTHRTRIRARYGHSAEVETTAPIEPPTVLGGGRCHPARGVVAHVPLTRAFSGVP